MCRFDGWLVLLPRTLVDGFENSVVHQADQHLNNTQLKQQIQVGLVGYFLTRVAVVRYLGLPDNCLSQDKAV